MHCYFVYRSVTFQITNSHRDTRWYGEWKKFNVTHTNNKLFAYLSFSTSLFGCTSPFMFPRCLFENRITENIICDGGFGGPSRPLNLYMSPAEIPTVAGGELRRSQSQIETKSTSFNYFYSTHCTSIGCTFSLFRQMLDDQYQLEAINRALQKGGKKGKQNCTLNITISNSSLQNHFHWGRIFYEVFGDMRRTNPCDKLENFSFESSTKWCLKKHLQILADESQSHFSTLLKTSSCQILSSSISDYVMLLLFLL